VVGVSTDEEQLACDFAAKMRVTFPMIKDRDRTVSGLYKVTWPIVKLNRRVTYVIDKEGVVRGAFHHELSIDRHTDDALRLLAQLSGKRPGA